MTTRDRSWKGLSDVTTRVLRAVVTRDARNDLTDLLDVVQGDKRRLFDALTVLEGRWLITWEGHGRKVRPRARGIQLLNCATYRTRGVAA
jgi:hypothetical protein